MKKLYTLTLAALTALSSLAATRTVDFSKMKLITDDALAKSLIGKKVAVENIKAADLNVNGMHKAPAKVAAMEQGLGTFPCTYEGLLSSNAGTHEGDAVLVWSDQYQDIEVTIPDCAIADLGADWDSEAGALVFGQVNYGKSGNYYIFQVPLNNGSLASTLSVPFDEKQKCYIFNETDGLAFAAVTTQGSIAGYYWAGENFTIGVSEFDYKLSISANEECTPDNKFAITITAGADIKSLKILDMAGDYTAADAALYGLFEYGEAIQAGTYTLDLNSVATKSQPYCFMLAGYNEEGQAVKYAETTVIVTEAASDVWKTIATVPYNNDFVSKYYNFSFANEAMELQENAEEPGRFRLFNPHAGHEYLHAGDCETHFIYLDARDPEWVNVEYSPSGLDFGDGHLLIGSFGGALGYTKEECTARGYAVPSLDGRAVVFPARSILAHESNYNKPGSWSFMNSDITDNDGNVTAEGAFEYALPELTLNVKVTDATGKAINGVEVSVGDTKATTMLGVAKLTLPADVDYLATVDLTAKRDGEGYDKALDVTKQVKLEGAKNEYTLLTDLSGVDAIEAAAEEGAVEYFNLQGVRIDTPAAGQVVIARQGSKVSKQLVK